MKIKQILQNSSNNLAKFWSYMNKLGVNDGYPKDIHQILQSQEKKWSDVGENNPKTENFSQESHSRNARATSAHTLEGYFNNNGHGFKAPYVIRNINSCNFDVMIYSGKLTPNKLLKVKQGITKAFKEMISQRIDEISPETKTIKLYIFNNGDDYKHYGSKFGLGLGNEGGKHYYIGQNDVFSQIYVYQDGNVYNLVHEIVHATIAYITDNKRIPTVINEGIAEKIQYNSDEGSTAQGVSIDATRKQLIGDYNLKKMLSLEYSNDPAQDALVYRVGHALTMYFDWQNPEILKNYLLAVRNSKDGNIDHANRILSQNYDNEKFKTFLFEHSTETEMKNINALKVERGEKLATLQELVGSQYENVTYYEANIKTMDRMEIVGKFSPVYHSSTGNTVRITSADMQSYFDLSQQYNFMKVVRHGGELKLTYCDRDGHEYKDSQEYQKQANHIRDHYRSDDYQNILEKLTYFDLNSVRNVKGQHFLSYLKDGAIFSLTALGAHEAKSISGISIYDDRVKIGELSGDITYVKVIKNDELIVHVDRLMNMYTTTFEEAYVAIRKEDQGYKISFIDGRKVEADQYFDTPHIHLNPLFDLSINNIEPSRVTTKILLRDATILDHADSETSKYSSNHTAYKPIIEKGKLLDDKGTEREIDDVYEANTVHLGNVIDTFRNIGFSISESNDLFISEHGKGLRYQLPQEITHLKLIKLVGNDGTIINRLVPTTQDGREFPDGMPNIPDEYRLIDPIFAHKYEKEDHSHQHVTIGLINFDQYATNDLFKVKYDPEDYHIKKDQEGNILRASNSTTYITKVKLYDQSGEQELGILSNDFHQFKGKVFISFDYNYSYRDFLMSYAPKITYKTLADGTKVGIFEQSESDISNNNYQDYKRVAISQDSIKFPIQSEAIAPEGQYPTYLDQNPYSLSSPFSIIGSNPAPNPFNIAITTLSAENNNTGIGINAYAAVGVGAIIGSTIVAAYNLYCYFKKKPKENEETYSFTPLDSLSVNIPNDDEINPNFTANHNAQYQRLVTFKPDTNNTREEGTCSVLYAVKPDTVVEVDLSGLPPLPSDL